MREARVEAKQSRKLCLGSMLTLLTAPTTVSKLSLD